MAKKAAITSNFHQSCIYFLSATCISPPYVLQLHNSVKVTKETTQQEFTDTDRCCSGLLITSANTTTCLENGEWELDTSQNCEGWNIHVC